MFQRTAEPLLPILHRTQSSTVMNQKVKREVTTLLKTRFDICICSLAVMKAFMAMAGRAGCLHSAQVYCERWSHLHLKRVVPWEIRQTAASNIYRSKRK